MRIVELEKSGGNNEGHGCTQGLSLRLLKVVEAALVTLANTTLTHVLDGPKGSEVSRGTQSKRGLLGPDMAAKPAI